MFSKYECLLIYFIYTLFNVDHLQLLLYKDKVTIHNIIYANSCQLQENKLTR